MRISVNVKMKLLSDAIFGNGYSIPGGEDISILCDAYGFPYYKGSTFKGIFREELTRYLIWTKTSRKEAQAEIDTLFGKSESIVQNNERELRFADFMLSNAVKSMVLEEIGTKNPHLVTDSMSHLRTFTSLREDGIVQENSLRNARCVNKNLIFYSSIQCHSRDLTMIEESLPLVKWVGSMRNRGFGKVQITLERKQGEPK